MTRISLALMALFTLSTLYALLLSTPIGREFTVAKTWVTVVAGCTLVLGALAWFWPAAGVTALLFFGVGGLPIVVRSLLMEFSERRRLHDRAMER